MNIEYKKGNYYSHPRVYCESKLGHTTMP